MALKKMFHRLTAPVRELDDERLRVFCATIPNRVPIAEARPREEITVAGEISLTRIVPRPDGCPWLEATISDGTGSLVAMWTGRTRIAGIRGGQRLIVRGRGLPNGPGGRLLIYNPLYELL